MARKKNAVAVEEDKPLEGMTIEDDNIPPPNMIEIQPVRIKEDAEETGAVTPKNVTPKRGDENWSDFLRGQLRKDELVDGQPSCDGLRRLFEEYIGEITDVEVSVPLLPNIQNINKAVALVKISYLDKERGRKCTIMDGADCGSDNVSETFQSVTTATAITRAESRALRKGLRFRVISSDEMPSTDSTTKAFAEAVVTSTAANDAQKRAIKNLSKKNRIDTTKLFASLEINSSLEDLNHKDAQAILQELQAYDRGPTWEGGKAVPVEILMDNK